MDIPRFALRSLAAASSATAAAAAKVATSLAKAIAPKDSETQIPMAPQGAQPGSSAAAPSPSPSERKGSFPTIPTPQAASSANTARPSNAAFSMYGQNQYAITDIAQDLPLGMVLPACPDNQRYSFTRPSSRYSSPCDGRLFAWDIANGYKTLMEMEFRSYHLSPLEKQVARCMLENDSNQAIGKKLLISESTVKYHVRNIYRKTASSGRSTFTHMIHEGMENSTHSWRSRRDLELEMESLQII